MFKNRYKYYLPGMISLVLIPLFCIYYLLNNDSFQEYRIMSLTMYEPESWGPIPKRKYEKYVIDNNEFKATKDISIIKQKLLNIIQQNDTTKGILIEFHKSAKHNSLIKSMNMLYLIDINCWIADKNHFWICNKYVEQNELFEPIPIYSCGLRYVKPEISFSDTLIIDFKKYMNFYPIFLGYIGLVIFYLININKNKGNL